MEINIRHRKDHSTLITTIPKFLNQFVKCFPKAMVFKKGRNHCHKNIINQE